MAEGWRQVFEDLRGALGLPTPTVQPDGAAPLAIPVSPQAVERAPVETPFPVYEAGAPPGPGGVMVSAEPA